MSEVSATDNGDGTFTYEIEVCVSDDAADSESFGFWIDWTGGGSLVSYQDSIVGAYTGNEKNASVPPVSGNGSIEYGDWDDTSTDTLTPAYEGECFTVTLTFDEPMQSFSGGGMQPNYISDGCEVSTSATYVCNSSYTYELNVNEPSCKNKTYDIEFNGNTVASNVAADGGSASYKYCGDCSFSFSAYAANNVGGGGCTMNSWDVVDSLGNTNTSGTGDVFGKTVSTCTLPIELLSFDSKCEKRGRILTWRTASETNNSHFLVQESSDGNYFRTIAEHEGAGTDPNGASYEVILKDRTGAAYYRLVQVDRDGKRAIFPVIHASSCDKGNGISLEVVGNGSERPTVRFRGPSSNERAVFRLFDAQGRLLQEMPVKAQTDEKRIVLKEDLESGVYFGRLRIGAESLSRKVVVRK